MPAPIIFRRTSLSGSSRAPESEWLAIPYITEVRPDTGLTNPRLGIWLFLASEVMLFGPLFAAYALLRVCAASWPDQSSVLGVPLASPNTVILIASSVTRVPALTAARMATLRAYRLYMGLTILGRALFLAIKACEYSDKFSHGLFPPAIEKLLHLCTDGTKIAEVCASQTRHDNGEATGSIDEMVTRAVRRASASSDGSRER